MLRSISRRSFLQFSALTTASMLASVACSPSTTLNQSEPLRMGLVFWPGFMPWQTAESRDLFTPEGLKVKLEWFPVQTEMMSAFVAGKLDVVIASISDLYVMLSQGAQAKVVLVTDYSNGADAILAAPSIKSIKDLAGKEALVELSTPGHLLLLNALESSGVPPEKVRIVNRPVDAAAKELIAGKAQVAYAWDPLVSEVVKSGKGKVLFSSREVPGLIPALVTVQQKFLDTQPEVIQRLIKVWYSTLEYRRNNLAEALPIEAKRAGVSVAEYEQLLKGLEWLTPQKSAAAFKGGYSTESLIVSAEVVSDFLVSQNVLKEKPPAIKTLIDDQFLKAYLESAT
jgi:NitT/TauT family transport system substrate-binding protein